MKTKTILATCTYRLDYEQQEELRRIVNGKVAGVYQTHDTSSKIHLRKRKRLMRFFDITRNVTLITIIMIVNMCLYGTRTQSFTIVPPSSKSDYHELASLLVESFDEPTVKGFSRSSAKEKNNIDVLLQDDDDDDEYNSNRMNNPISFVPKRQLEKITWSLYDKFLTEQYTFRQYVQTARKMKGKKYGLFLAKEYNPGISEKLNEEARPFYEVIGMVEIGMVLECIQNSTVEDSRSIRPRATVGVLCVKSNHMNKGVGKELLHKCEEVVREVWNETELFIEVEPTNKRALKFFTSCGYDTCLDRLGKEMIHVATVSRKRKMEERPHFVMSKILKPSSQVLLDQ